MREDSQYLWVLAERWPAFLVAPVYYVGGYTVLQVLTFSIATVMLAEVVFRIVRARLLDRRRAKGR